MEESEYKILDDKITQLIKLCQQLKDENTALLKADAEWQAERAELQHRNDEALRQIDAMVLRLKTLEQNA